MVTTSNTKRIILSGTEFEQMTVLRFPKLCIFW